MSIPSRCIWAILLYQIIPAPFHFDSNPDSDPSRLVPHTLNSITSVASIDHNWTTSISPDLLPKRPSLSSRAQDRTVSPSAGPCPHILARAEVHPFSEARRLASHVAHEPLGAHQQPVPRPSVLGRTIIAAECVSLPAPSRARRLEDSVGQC